MMGDIAVFGGLYVLYKLRKAKQALGEEANKEKKRQQNLYNINIKLIEPYILPELMRSIIIDFHLIPLFLTTLMNLQNIKTTISI